ncbi:HEAT repeat-containing protein 1 [Scophthalmus maximus]|nr:HEAT repeat-containing protein 1 [Scophthalmus maximus]
MTSLAHQLKRLALPQSDAALLTRKDIASLLFDPKDAASMDRSTFYALGCTGLEELLGIEPAFQEFQDTLFSRASLTLERSVQSKEVNEKLDAGISLFLVRLSPYFLLKPAHKCIEWLVHRFHVQLYNVDSLLACALPYHDTNVFVRVLQLLRIKDPTNRWNWLHCLQKPGVPLSRGALIAHCYSDLSFMDFVCTMVTKSVQAYSGHSGSCSQLRVIFSFYASTIVPALDAVDKVSDTIISKLLPFVQQGFKSPLSDYKAATYMIVCQLAVKVVMEASLVNSLATHISKSLVKEPVLAQEGLGCLIVLLQNQRGGACGARAFSQLCSMPELVSTLQVIAAAHDVTPLLRHLLPHLICQVFAGSSGENRDLGSRDVPTEPDELAVLESVLKAVPLPTGLDQTVARLLLDEYLSQTELSAENLSTLDQRLLPLVRLFESRYCGALDGVLAGHVTDLRSPEQKHLFHQFLSLSLSSGKYQILGDSDTSLLLSLKHPQPSVRVSAVNHLMSLVTSGQSLDEVFLKDAVMDRVKDDVPEVVAAALGMVEVMFDRFDPEDVASCLLSLLLRVDLSVAEHWLPVMTQAVCLLSDPRLGKGDAEQQQRTGWRLLPFLVIGGVRPDSAQRRLAACVARSPVLAQHPLTFNWAEEMDELTKRHSEHGFVGLANERLASTLTRNLANMEHFSRRDAVEKLLVLVEEQRSSGPRTRTSFLVLTRTLLLGLGGLSETQHLLYAQRLFALLERPLLEVVAGDDHVQEVERPVSFCDTLTVYLSRCERRAGERLDAEFGFVLFALLGDFVSSLRCHDASFKGEMWWNPEKMDTNTCCYLGLVCRLFSVAISGAGDGPAASSFRELMKLLVQVHLGEPVTLFRFLCMLWGYGSNHGDQLDVKVGAVLQTRALYMGQAVLSVQPAATLQELASTNSPVVPSLLCCLTSPVREVRRAALAALQSLSGANASPFQPITEKLLKTSEEIVADSAYLSSALSVLHEDSSSREVKASMQQLLRSVQTPCCPSYSAAVLLRALSLVNGQSVLTALLPVLDRLLEQSGPDTPALLRSEAQLVQLVLGKFNDASAPLLAEDQNCLHLFVRALKTSTQTHPDVRCSQIIALEQMTRSFFSAVGDEQVQQQLLTVMFDVLLESRSPLASSSVSSVFKGMAVDAQLVANELSPPQRPRVSVTVQQTRRSKTTQRKPAEGEPCPEGGAVPWQRVTLILELLQHKKKLKRAQALVPVLFSLLSRSLEPCAGEHANMEYTKQLLLSCLLNVCNRLTAEGGAKGSDVLDEEKFSVELVVQVIRASDTPQTHHHALLLLGAVASIFPDKVLHNIMPIFTFMGANILRLDDAYSFRVIDKTVQMVIPALLQAHQLPDGESSACVLAVVTRIMHVFADALPHVPDHRRLPVLTQLVTTLGPARFLWVLMLLLFKLHAEQTASSVSDKEACVDVDFWISVCCQFDVSDQLVSLVHILNFLQQLPHDKLSAPVKRASRTKQQQEEDEEELIFSVETHSSKELRHFKFLCVSFMAQLLGSAHFISKVADGGGDDDDESLQRLQQRLLEENLRYIHSVARCVEENADKPTAKFWRVLLNKSYDVLDKVNALLPTDTFITVMRGLMGNQLASVRRKAMELLNNKLQHRTQWEEPQVTMFLQLTGDLLSIVGKGHMVMQEEEADHAINRQTALYSLKLLCRTFGSDHQEAFIPVLQQTVEIVASAEEEKNVTGSALLCVAEVVSTLKALAIPQLPRLMPAVLLTLTDRKELLTNEIYLLSAVTALQRVTETLPHFISPYLQDVTLQVCRLTRLVESSSSSSSSSSSAQLALRLAALRSSLATQLPPRVLLPTISKCYSNMVVDKKAQLVALMSILKEHITHMEKDQLSSHQSELSTFFLCSLDYRSKHCQGDLEKTSQVEGCVIDCLIAMVMKLSEVTFRPLFFKLFDWSKSDSNERLLTFYRLCDSVAERLKGLFVLFAGNLVKPISDLLRRTNSCRTDEPLFGGCGGEEKIALLLHCVLDCLQKIFLYDTQRFLSRERADALMSPLVDQLENTWGAEPLYQQTVTQHLVPCVAQFSVALNDDAQWKTLNYQILMKTRHSDAKVRFSSLLMLLELASKLKENYVVLLPETIPFLAELMEDECEEVEQQVQKVVQAMENILGEPLQSYF